MASKVKGDLRKKLLQKFSHNPVQLAKQGQTGRKVSVMMNAVDEVDSYYSSYMPTSHSSDHHPTDGADCDLLPNIRVTS